MFDKVRTALFSGALVVSGAMFGVVSSAQAGVTEIFFEDFFGGPVDVIQYDYVHDADTDLGVAGIAVEYDPNFFNPSLIAPMSFRLGWGGFLTNQADWDAGQNLGVFFDTSGLDGTFGDFFGNELPVVVFSLIDEASDAIAPGESSIGEFLLMGQLEVASDFIAVCTNGQVCQQGTTNAQQTAIPEPATMALLGAGLLGIGAMQRRRRTA